MKTKRKIAILINFGTEYRVFFSSGLYDLLKSENYEIVVLKRGVKNSILDDYFFKNKVSVIDIDKKLLEKKRTLFERYFQSVRQAYMRRNGLGVFRNYNPKDNSYKLKEFLLGNKLTYSIFKAIVDFQIPRYYKDDNISYLIQKEGITDLIVSGYASVGSILFAVNGIKININVWTFINSWKDFYINDYVPFKPNALFVWSQSMKNNYITMNKHLDKSKIIPIGYLPYDYIFDKKMYYSKEYYQKKYNYQTNSSIILYTMLDPERFANEEKIIELISKQLSNEFYEKSPIILVKKNPYDNSNYINKYFSDFSNVRIVEHFSERNKKEDFFVQSYDGEKEWGDLLQISCMTMGAASTVALESLISKTPVITIAFDMSKNKSQVLFDMAQAPFYKELLKRDDVSLSLSLDELIDRIKDILENKIEVSNIPEIVGETYAGDTLFKCMEVIRNV